MLRAVGFDLWETLITDTPELTRRQESLRFGRITAILEGRGELEAAQQLERAYRDVWRRCHDLYWTRDEDISCRRQIEHLIEELGLNPQAFEPEALDAIEDAYARAALDVVPGVVDGALEVLKGVRARGMRVGLISNTGRTPGYVLREVLERLELASEIDFMVFSNEHGECKPKPSIFEHLRLGLDVRFEETVFVGDNLHVDVVGAQLVGMRAVHFDPPVRGTAVAPAPLEPGEVMADARITSLRELPGVLDSWIAQEGSR